MSTTFRHDKTTEVSERSGCLCAQMAPTWRYPLDITPDVEADLKAHAWDKCPRCGGTGIETSLQHSGPELNVCNENRTILMQLLGLTDDSIGSLPLPQARRALMVARSRIGRFSGVRADEVVYGRPRPNDDGTIELHPIRVVSQGCDQGRLESYLNRLDAILADGSAVGAERLVWS